MNKTPAGSVLPALILWIIWNVLPISASFNFFQWKWSTKNLVQREPSWIPVFCLHKNLTNFLPLGWAWLATKPPLSHWLPPPGCRRELEIVRSNQTKSCVCWENDTFINKKYKRSSWHKDSHSLPPTNRTTSHNYFGKKILSVLLLRTVFMVWDIPWVNCHWLSWLCCISSKPLAKHRTVLWGSRVRNREQTKAAELKYFLRFFGHKSKPQHYEVY